MGLLLENGDKLLIGPQEEEDEDEAASGDERPDENPAWRS